jgi:hypothetical protein
MNCTPFPDGIDATRYRISLCIPDCSGLRVVRTGLSQEDEKNVFIT